MLEGKFLNKVVCHEMCHVFSFSYNLNLPIETEEIIADFMSLFGRDIIYLADDIMNNLIRRIA
nr:MAG TPA: peptidase [Caudoviricetes sp.]